MAKQTFTTGQVLTAAQMTSLQQTAMLGGAASAKTASYTLVAADAGTAISMSNASATTITVNTALFAAGDTVQITNLGAGVCTITAGTATVNTSASLALAQYESGTLDFISTSSAVFVKGAGAAGAAIPSYTLLNAGGTATTSGSTVTVSFTAYNSLAIIIRGVSDAATAGTFTMRFNSDSGANYWYSGLKTSGSPASTIAAGRSTADTKIDLGTTGNNQDSQDFGQVLVFGAAGTGIKPFINNNWFGYTDAISSNTGGQYMGTSAITSVSIITSNAFDFGTLYVYGAN